MKSESQKPSEAKQPQPQERSGPEKGTYAPKGSWSSINGQAKNQKPFKLLNW